jgi:hypothetical protein
LLCTDIALVWQVEKGKDVEQLSLSVDLRARSLLLSLLEDLDEKFLHIIWLFVA